MTKNSAVAALAAVFAILALAPAANATTVEVTRTDDPAPDGCATNGCTLREAAAQAEAADGNTVHLPASATPYTLSTNHLQLFRNTTIQGDGAGSTTISGDSDNRVLVMSGTGKTLTVNAVTITGGHDTVDGSGGAIVVQFGGLALNGVVVTGNSVAVPGNASGGGIQITTAGNATLTDSTVSANTVTNTANGSIASGGGIGAVGPLTLVRSTVSGNGVSSTGSPNGQGRGGGVFTQNTTSITDSTISGNTADGITAQGGGLFAQNAGGVVTLDHATLAGNSVTTAPFARQGGNLFSSNTAQIKLGGTIVAGGAGASGKENCDTLNSGTFTSLGSNIEDRNQCGLAGGELHDTDPQLLALAAYGGPNQTRAIRAASPARDASGSCGLTVDQRGFGRIGPCDIGAFEYQAAVPVARAAASTAQAGIGQTVTFDGTGSSDSDPGDALSFSWRFDDGATATGPTASHAFATAGAHTATLTVTDPLAKTATATATVVVAPPPPPAATADTTAPKLSGARFDHSTFAAAGSGPSAQTAKRKPPVGARVSYSLSEAATVTFTVERATSGRKVGRRCVAPTRSNRAKARCTRFVAVRGSFTRSGKAGANRFKFTGRVGGRKLSPGSYQLLGSPRDAAGNRGSAVRASFRIVR